MRCVAFQFSDLASRIVLPSISANCYFADAQCRDCAVPHVRTNILPVSNEDFRECVVVVSVGVFLRGDGSSMIGAAENLFLPASLERLGHRSSVPPFLHSRRRFVRDGVHHQRHRRAALAIHRQ